MVCGVPQEVILSLKLFDIYMCPLARLIQGVRLMTPSYLVMDSQQDSAPETLARALEAVDDWLQQNWLKLRPIKKQALFLNHGALDLGIQLAALVGHHWC